MNLSVDCECGKVIAVSSASAGDTVRCPCGRLVIVPPLSEMRRRAGLAPIPQNAAEKVKSLISSSELPDNKLCPFTGRLADTTIWLRVDCESKWIRGKEPLNDHLKLLFIFLFGWVGAVIALLRSNKPIEEFGREVYVEIPLKVSGDALNSTKLLKSHSKLKNAIKCSAAYVQLLNEYPSAYVSFVRKT